MTDEQIGLAPVEIGIDVRFRELDRQAGMRRDQGGEAGREESRAPLSARHANDAVGAVGQRRTPAIDGRRRVGHALRERQQGLSRGREPVAVLRALEQPRADALLETLHVTHDRRLTELEHARGAAEATGLGERPRNTRRSSHCMRGSVIQARFESGAGCSALDDCRRPPNGGALVAGGRTEPMWIYAGSEH